MTDTDAPKPRPKRTSTKRLLVIIVIGLLLLGAAQFVRHYYLSAPPLGKGPAGPAVPRGPFEQVWSTRKVFFLGFGDSIAAGFGGRPGHGAFDRMTSNPIDEYPDMQGICLKAVFPNVAARNVAISGSTSIQHMEDELPLLEKQPPDVLGLVMITTGGNDIIHSYGKAPPREGAMYGATLEQAKPWIESFEKRLDEMLARIEECFPGGCQIFLANIYDPTDDGGAGVMLVIPSWPDALRVLHAYNEVIARCASRRPNTHLVDIYTPFLGHGFRCNRFWVKHYRAEDPYFWYFQNVEDPNDRGHDAIRRLFLIEIAKAFGKMQG